MSKFLITGLPRSRTAWWSALCSAAVDNTICFHEPCSLAQSWEQSLDVWATPGYTNVGIADSSLGFHLEEILAVHRPRTLVIKRPIDEVEKSLAEVGIKTPGYCQILNERIVKTYGYDERVRWISYTQLEDYEVVKDCLLWLCIQTSVDLVKVRQFMDLNVQVSVDSVQRKLKNCKANIEDLLGGDVVEEIKAWQILHP
jgi:hypothetical protein